MLQPRCHVAVWQFPCFIVRRTTKVLSMMYEKTVFANASEHSHNSYNFKSTFVLFSYVNGFAFAS